MTLSRRCPNPAVVKQMRRHASTVKLLMEHVAPVATERWLCEEHADVVDDDWVLIEAVNHGDVASVLRWADKQCEWEDEG